MDGSPSFHRAAVAGTDSHPSLSAPAIHSLSAQASLDSEEPCLTTGGSASLRRAAVSRMDSNPPLALPLPCTPWNSLA